MDIVEKYLRTFRKNTSTPKTYRSHIKKFFKVNDADPETYLEEDRDYEEDVIRLWESLEGRPPKTINGTMSAVKKFLEEYDILRGARIWDKLQRRTKGSRARTMDKTPSPGELKEILQYGNVKDKALFLMLSSSGMRIGEALQLVPDDIEMEHEPTRINIRGQYTKTGNPRLTFISQEATDHLQTWLRGREKYLINAAKKTNFDVEKVTDDPRIFPFVYNTARKAWIRLIKKAGYDEKDPQTGRYKYHIHSLRKYFRTYMGTANVSTDIIEALMGHEGYLTAVYRRYRPEHLAEFYRKGEEKIVVFQSTLDTEQISERMRQMEREKMQLRKDLDRVMDIVARNTRPYLAEGGGLCGNVKWQEYEDGTKQIVIFDKEERDFVPVGDRIPTDKIEDPMEAWRLEEREMQKVAEQLEKP